MDDMELQEKIALLREKRGRNNVVHAETIRSLPPAEDAAWEEAGSAARQDVPEPERGGSSGLIPAPKPAAPMRRTPDTRSMRFDSRTPGRVTRERVPVSRRLDYYPEEFYDPTEPPLEETAARKESVWGAVAMQAILVLTVAILFAVCRLLSPGLASNTLSLVKDKSANDFSFRDALYQMAGDVLTTLNEWAPTQVGSTQVGSTQVESSQPDAPAGSPETDVPDSPESPPMPTDSSADIAAATSDGLDFTNPGDGQGGVYTPAANSQMPTDATFAPIVFTGALTFPLKTGWRQTSAFGFRESPIYGGNEFHAATDIAAPKDTNILAVFDGTVTESGQDRWLGNYIRIDHGNGFHSTYGHCDRLIARAGMRVRRGEVIAKVGSTGDSTGYHLHLALEMDGLLFDPAWFFPQQLYSMWNEPET